MSNRVRLRITGIQELRHAIKQYGQALAQAAVDAVTDAVEDTTIRAKYLAPVGSYSPGDRRRGGTLRDRIKGSVKIDGYSVRGVVRARAPHSSLIEFGTARIRKRPYLLPAAIPNRRRLNRELAAAVRRHAPAALGTPQITGEGPATPGVSVD